MAKITLTTGKELIERVGKALDLKFITDVRLSANQDGVLAIDLTVLLTTEQLAIILGKEV